VKKPLIATLATIAALLGGLFPSSASAADDAGGDAGTAAKCPLVWDDFYESFVCDDEDEAASGSGGAGTATGTGGGGGGSAGDARTGSGGMGGSPSTGSVGGARWRRPGSGTLLEWSLLLAQQKECRKLLQEIREEDQWLDNAERRGLRVDRHEARKLRRRWRNSDWDCESNLGVGSD